MVDVIVFRGARCVAALILGLLLLASCRKPVSANFGTPFDVGYHQAARFPRNAVELFFRRVASDSRCPRGVQCVTAGDAVVTLEGRVMKGYPESFDVRLPGGEAATDSTVWTRWQGYRIRMVKLDPEPVAGRTPDSLAYAVTLLVEKI